MPQMHSFNKILRKDFQPNHIEREQPQAIRLWELLNRKRNEDKKYQIMMH